MKAEDCDRKFDDGEDVAEHLDLSRARRPRQESRRVSVDFPAWMVEALDDEARRQPGGDHSDPERRHQYRRVGGRIGGGQVEQQAREQARRDLSGPGWWVAPRAPAAPCRQ